MGNYKIVLEIGWEFIVTADNEKEVLEKVEEKLESLIREDGFTMLSIKDKEDIKSNKYSIEEYDGFILN